MPSVMAKKRKLKWDQKPCGCVKTTLSIGRVVIRCPRHRGKASKKRMLCFWDAEGIVQRETTDE